VGGVNGLEEFTADRSKYQARKGRSNLRNMLILNYIPKKTHWNDMDVRIQWTVGTPTIFYQPFIQSKDWKRTVGNI